MKATTHPLLEMRGIGKRFPGVQALQSVDLTLHRGEVLALLGENGAGKSTLIKILGGAHRPDAGSISMDGQPLLLAEPSAADAAGIGVIYQEFNLVPQLTAWENIFLGRERSRLWVHRGKERQRTADLFQQMGVELPLDVPCAQLSVAQQQIVEIAKTLAQDAQVIVMDEPTAALTPQEVRRLFDVVRDLQRRGMGVIYISHRLDEIFEVADRVMVLRDGQTVGQAPTDQLTRDQMIEWMVGRTLENEFPSFEHERGDVRLAVRGLSRGRAVRDVSFDIRAGEILGMTGLVGAGRTEIARLIFGADRADAGEMTLDGDSLRLRSPRDAIAAGICLLTEDRKHQGLMLGASVRENFSLPNLRQYTRWGLIRQSSERDALEPYVRQLKIRIPHSEQLAGSLSGGNQQKVVLAKWLQRNAEVVIFDEPTRGIDVGAKYEIYQLMGSLARRGKAILVISSELPEVLGISDRILVIHDGHVAGELDDPSTATQEQIMDLAVG